MVRVAACDRAPRAPAGAAGGQAAPRAGSGCRPGPAAGGLGAMAGYSGKPLSQKLGLKPGFCIFVDGAPSDYRKLVGEWPEGAKLVGEARPPLDMVHLFVAEAKGLAARLRSYREAVAPDGTIWVSWPKKASGVATDLSDVVVRDTALPLGLVDIKVCAVDEVWSGLKFVIPKPERIKRSK